MKKEWITSVLSNKISNVWIFVSKPVQLQDKGARLDLNNSSRLCCSKSQHIRVYKVFSVHSTVTERAQHSSRKHVPIDKILA